MVESNVTKMVTPILFGVQIVVGPAVIWTFLVAEYVDNEPLVIAMLSIGFLYNAAVSGWVARGSLWLGIIMAWVFTWPLSLLAAAALPYLLFTGEGAQAMKILIILIIAASGGLVGAAASHYLLRSS